MQVSTLASEAATRIKANPQLVRTAALYHDIGKMDDAPFFTENQNGVNPHDKLTPQESAHIITGHVEKGLELADKFGLPESIRGFIASHHGKGVARYFYIKYNQAHPDLEPDPHDFSYPGPNPYSKETAILMMADAVEAASRSLSEYTEESIGDLVDKIIDTQVQEGYFRDCPISWQEINRVKETFKEKLRTMYHTRISYPEPTAGPDQKKQ
jgi:putative nucleotidyltransferase with HDIG domain